MSAFPATISGSLPYCKPSTKGNSALVLPNNQIQVRKVTYPDSDGKPMADNTRQYKEIVTLVENLKRIFKNNPFIFVAGDLLWYTVEGNNKIRQAPDVMVVFGRPPGYRGCYKQWEEDGIAPQFVVEVNSPGNRSGKMRRKLSFYERYGVQEYYLYYPEEEHLRIWLREGEYLIGQALVNQQWTSPLTQVKFDLSSGQLVCWRPDGSPFETFEDLDEKNVILSTENTTLKTNLTTAEAEIERLKKKLKDAGISINGLH